ncbi:hypothetical protein [Brevibacillus sp. NRS-1366]|uniref:hypothetical protein n=1 Tax=Brevibacillus sp. NRS-1366 TaxID=3233899 RepID=UPI003D258F3D
MAKNVQAVEEKVDLLAQAQAEELRQSGTGTDPQVAAQVRAEVRQLLDQAGYTIGGVCLMAS